MSPKVRRPSGYPYEPPRPRTALAWGGAIFLLGALAAGLLGAAIVLWRVIDIDSVLQAATDEALPPVAELVAEVPLPSHTVTVPWSAYVYESQNSAGFFPDSSALASLSARWEALLTAIGADVVRLSGTGELVSVPVGDLLVVPSGVCLDSDERMAVARRVQGGGHVLVTWGYGVRDAECEWVGFESLEKLAGASAAGALEPRPPTYVTVPYGGAMAAGLPPGTRIELKSEPWIVLRAESSNAFWSDWALNPLAAPGGGAASAAVARVTDAGARVAWFGARIDVAATEHDQRLVDRLLQNAALWAAGHVIVDVEPWPDGYRAAMAVTQDAEHSFRNSRFLAERFAEINIPVTFFVVTQIASKYPEFAQLFSAAGEVGTHGVDHRQVAGRLWSTQLAGLRQAGQAVKAWADVQPVGFRPPRELFDAKTLEAWKSLGGTYIAASNYGRSAAPGIFDVRGGPVVVLPRVVDDDYAVIVARRQGRPDSLRSALEAGLQKMRSLGGLDLVTLHSQLIDSDERVAAIEAAVRSAQQARDVWIATGAEIADWWLDRSELEVEARERADLSVVLAVRNGGARVVSSAWLHVILPRDHTAYAAPENGEEIVWSQYGHSGLRLELPTLDPGASVEILVPRLSR